MNVLWCCVHIYVSDPQHCKVLAIDKKFFFFSLFRLFSLRVLLHFALHTIVHTFSYSHVLPRSESYRSMVVFSDHVLVVDIQ
jgi:hypothetical protein